MKKTAKWTCVLIASLGVAFLALSLIDGPESPDTLTGRLRRATDNLLYFIHLKQQRRPKFSLCIHNLQCIQLSKVDWANNEMKTTDDIPTWNDLGDYLASYPYMTNGIPVCPDGGTVRPS